MFRKILLALTVAASLAGAARAQIGPSPAAPTRGYLEIDPRGVLVAGKGLVSAATSGQGDHNTAVLQAAVDAAKAKQANYPLGSSPRAKILIPADPRGYEVGSPVFVDAPNIEFVGEGRGASRLSMTTGRGYWPFVFNFPRVGAGHVADASFRPTTTGKLDSTATGKNAFRSNGTGHIYAPGGVLSHGGMSPSIAANLTVADAWTETTGFTFEVSLEGFASGILPAEVIIGSGVAPIGPCSPFALRSLGGGAFTFYLSTQAAPYAVPVTTAYSFTSPAPTGVQRVAVQVDLPNSLVNVFVGGNGAQPVQVAVTGGVGGGGGIAPGSKLNQNLHDFFGVGKILYSYMGAWGTAVPDFAVYGCCIKRGLSYAPKGTGNAPAFHPQAAGSASAAVLYLSGTPTGGTFTVSYGGQTTAALPFNVTASALQTALQGLSTIGAGKVLVTNRFTGAFDLAAAGGFSFAQSGIATAGLTCDGSNLTGGALADAARYFPSHGSSVNLSDPNVLGFLAFTEPTTGNPRHLSVTGGNYHANATASSAFLAHTDQFNGGTGNQFFFQGGNAVRDLEILAHPLYGGGILYAGGTYNFEVERVKCDQGSIGCFWAMHNGANYTSKFEHCQVGATDTPFLGIESIVWARDIDFTAPGRSCFKFHGGCLDARDVFVTGWSYQVESLIQAYYEGYGGVYAADNWLVDFEGNPFGRSPFLFERSAANITTATLKNIAMGTVSGSRAVKVPAIELRDVGNSINYRTAELVVENLSGIVDASALIQGDGRGWHFDVTAPGPQPDQVQDVISLGTFGRLGGIVRTRSRSPLRSGTATAGTSVTEVPAPEDGQFARFRAVKDGTWGTATPPAYVGQGATQLDPNASLAAYPVGHTAGSATVAGHASLYGATTGYGSHRVAQALFNGVALAPPSTWYAALFTNDPGRSTSYIGDVAGNESDGAGGVVGPGHLVYARAAIANNATNFPAASAGSKSNATAITFPTLTGTVTATAVYFYDASTAGSAWFVFKFPAPVTFASGSTPSIPIGALTLANAPPPGSSLGTYTDFGWGKVHDALLGNAALGNPATWYLGLSTAAMSRTSTTPTEPSGNGYARAGVAADTSHFSVSQVYDQQWGDASNVSAVAFPSPTGTWGSCVAAALMPASGSGTAWMVAPLTAPVAPINGGAAPTFAPGAYYTGL
jgi:hypothetical protein